MPIKNNVRDDIKEEVKYFLTEGKYEHEFAKLSKNSIDRLKLVDLIRIYEILIRKIIHIPSIEANVKSIIRPICPIIGPKKLNQARDEYKLGMIRYIKQFGIYLTEDAPCNYSPALLEALANYCEKSTK